MNTAKTVRVDRLIIRFNTNLPSKSEELVEFTRRMIVLPPDQPPATEIILENYPFITADIKYPRKYLSKLNYQDRVRFFQRRSIYRCIGESCVRVIV